VIKHLDDDDFNGKVVHFFGFLCYHADEIPDDFLLTVLHLAPEAVRFENEHGIMPLYDALGPGQASLSVIEAMVSAGDQLRDEGTKSILEVVCGEDNIFCVASTVAMSWVPHNLWMFSDRIEVLYYILEEGGTKSVLCSRGGSLPFSPKMKKALDTVQYWETRKSCALNTLRQPAYLSAIRERLTIVDNAGDNVQSIIARLTEAIEARRQCEKSSRGGSQCYLLNDIVEMIRTLNAEEQKCPYDDDDDDDDDDFSIQKCIIMTKELLLHAASKMFSSWTGRAVPSTLFTAIWSAQYMTRWVDSIEHDGVAIEHDVVNSVLSDWLAKYPAQLGMVDERDNNPLHVAAGLNCWLDYDYPSEIGTDWSGVVRLLLTAKAGLLLQPNKSGRLPLHVALANYMTWNYGVKELIAPNPETLRITDPLTRLLPFMSAGAEDPNRRHAEVGLEYDSTGEHGQNEEFVLSGLETSYRLLREDPAVILLVWGRN